MPDRNTAPLTLKEVLLAALALDDRGEFDSLDSMVAWCITARTPISEVDFQVFTEPYDLARDRAEQGEKH